MNLSALQPGRRIVPRWRSYAATLKSRELGRPAQKQSSEPIPTILTNRLELFSLSPGLVTAAEAVEAAIVCGREGDAVNAARRIINIDADAAPLIREQAAGLLRRTGNGSDVPPEIDAKPRPDASAWRRFTRLHPDDPISWVELALEQTIRGHARAAVRSMAVALHLAPTNRHVVRCASRLYLHLDDLQHAYEIVARNAATASDPWLMAAEIALADVAERSPRFFKAGLAAVENAAVTPHQITELAGAIGTDDLLSGNRKRSRKMFTQSMCDPTGNSLAQGEWAAPHFGSELVTYAKLNSVSDSAEARAFHLYRETRFSEVLKVCDEWADSDPFSIRPFEFSATTAALIEEYDHAIAVATRGLQLRREAPILLCAAAFALASTDRLDEAERMLSRIPKPQPPARMHVISANRGLVAYRRGRFAEGRSEYMGAIDGFKQLGAANLVAQAQVYLAREANRAKEPDAERLLQQAEAAVKRFEASETSVPLRLLEARLGRIKSDPGRSARDSSQKKTGVSRDVTWTTPGLPAQHRINVLGDGTMPVTNRPKAAS